MRTNALTSATREASGHTGARTGGGSGAGGTVGVSARGASVVVAAGGTELSTRVARGLTEANTGSSSRGGTREYEPNPGGRETGPGARLGGMAEADVGGGIDGAMTSVLRADG